VFNKGLRKRKRKCGRKTTAPAADKFRSGKEKERKKWL
jgi:hypothetical protein